MAAELLLHHEHAVILGGYEETWCREPLANVEAFISVQGERFLDNPEVDYKECEECLAAMAAVSAIVAQRLDW